MSNILGIIPARAGSKRLKNKNLRLLNGKPLYQYIFEAAKNVDLINQLICSTDIPEILHRQEDYPYIKMVERPVNIAGDQALAIEYVNHALQIYPDKKFDYAIILQCSSPFTTSEDIVNAIQITLQNNYEGLVSVMEVPHDIHPTKFKYLDNNILKSLLLNEESNTAAHQMEKIYVRNGSIYISSIKTILSGKIIPDNCAAYIMPRARSIDINDEIDLSFAEFLIQKQK